MPVSNRVKNGLSVLRLFPAYLLFGLLKHLVPLKRLVRWAWYPPVGPRDRTAERGLTACVLRLSQLTKLRDRDCLPRSLLLYRVLSRAGADPTLVIGFRQVNGRLLGHAWVIVDGHPVIQGSQLPQFAAILEFGAWGAVIAERPHPYTVFGLHS